MREEAWEAWGRRLGNVREEAWEAWEGCDGGLGGM